MKTIDDVMEWTEHHEESDNERHKETQRVFSEMPKIIDVTVQRQVGRIITWIGLGAFIMIVSVGVAWGALTTQVGQHEEKLRTTLDQKDLANIQLQLNSQTATVQEIRGDVKSIINALSIPAK